MHLIENVPNKIHLSISNGNISNVIKHIGISNLEMLQILASSTISSGQYFKCIEKLKCINFLCVSLYPKVCQILSGSVDHNYYVPVFLMKVDYFIEKIKLQRISALILYSFCSLRGFSILIQK